MSAGIRDTAGIIKMKERKIRKYFYERMQEVELKNGKSMECQS